MLSRPFIVRVDEDLNKGLFVAYIIDKPKVYSRTSRKVLIYHISQYTSLPGCTDQDMILADSKSGTHVIFTQFEAQLLIEFKCASAVSV